MAATVRFSRIVEACGQPHVHTLWLQPDNDAELKKARDAHRVMTVHRGHGKADSAIVGFEKNADKNAQYLIFPKSLRRFARAHVVGLKFDLVEQPKFSAVDADAWNASTTAAEKKKKASGTRTSPDAPMSADFTATWKPADESGSRATRRPPPKRLKRNGSATSAPAVSKTAAKTVPSANSKNEPSALVREVRAALRELQGGKTVAAHQRLERALKR